MEHEGGFGGNPLSNFTLSFPTPATIGAQANGSEPFISGAGMPWPGHPNANALDPPAAAVAPQTFQPESYPYYHMPQAGALNASPFEHFSGAEALNINILSSQTFQPNNYTHGGWPQQQAPPAPPAGTNSYGGATGWAPPMPHPAGWPTSWAPPAQQLGGEAMSWVPPAQQPGGQMSWAPPMQQQPGGEAMSWAPPASGSAQAQPPVMMTGMSLEEFLMEADIIDERAVNDMIIENLIKDLMGDGPADSGPVQPGGPVVSLGGFGQPAGSSSAVWAGQRSDQVRDPEAVAAQARARRSRRMAKRKEAIARARPGN